MGTTSEEKGAETRTRAERAALALAIVEALAWRFRDPDEDVNGGDLVDWLGARLDRDGFLREARAEAEAAEAELDRKGEPTQAQRFVEARKPYLGTPEPLPAELLVDVLDYLDGNAIVVFVDGSAAWLVPLLGPGEDMRAAADVDEARSERAKARAT